MRSFGEAQRLFLSHLSATVVLTDCLHGFLLSASIVFIFLGATSLRDYFRHLRELGGQDGEREDDADRNGARAFRRPPGQANRNFAGDAIGEDAGGAPVLGGAGQMIRRNAENVAARLEMQAARLEAHVEQMFDVEDADGAEDVPFDELVGMQGPVFHLVENAFTVECAAHLFLDNCSNESLPFKYCFMCIFVLESCKLHAYKLAFWDDILASFIHHVVAGIT